MKKWSLLFVSLLITAAAMLSSCVDDDEIDEVDPGPSLYLRESAGFISTNDTIQINTEIAVGVFGLKSPVSGNKLTRFKFSVISKNVQTTFVDSIFSSDSFDWETKIIPTPSEDGVKLLFELWDKGGMRIEKSFDLILFELIIVIDPGPEIHLKEGTGYTFMDSSIWVNSPIKVGVTGQKSSVSGAKLTHFRFSIISNNFSTTWIDTTFFSDSFDWETDIGFTGTGDAKLVFELTDKNGMKNAKEFYIVVVDPGTAINKYVDVEFGSWNDAVGSFFASNEGVVYTISQTYASPANQARIDFLYFYGTTNKNTIASPDDADANSIDPLKLNLWTNKNPTRFNPVNMTVDQFNAIGSSYQFPAFDYSTQTTKMNNLRVNDIFMFKTKDNKLGLVMISNLSTPTRGNTAKATILVQK